MLDCDLTECNVIFWYLGSRGPTSTPKVPFKLVIMSFDKGAAESCETIILSPFKLIRGTCYTASSYSTATLSLTWSCVSGHLVIIKQYRLFF